MNENTKINIWLAIFSCSMFATVFFCFGILPHAVQPQSRDRIRFDYGALENHPDTTKWGMEAESFLWYCYEHHTVEFWNGTHVITWGNITK